LGGEERQPPEVGLLGVVCTAAPFRFREDAIGIDVFLKTREERLPSALGYLP
jgi:hypothetical protein